MERFETGIEGFDELIEGGIPESSVILLSGGPGAGKTTFSSQYIWKGLQKGDTCVYITTEESPEDIKKDVKEFGFDFSKYEGDSLYIKYMDPTDSIEFVLSDIKEFIENKQPERVVLDSLSVLGSRWVDDGKLRSNISNVIKFIRKNSKTAIITAEKQGDIENKFSKYGIAEFVADGVILLEYISIGQEAFGNLEIRKLRRTNIAKGKYETIIGNDGIRIGSKTLNMR